MFHSRDLDSINKVLINCSGIATLKSVLVAEVRPRSINTCPLVMSPITAAIFGLSAASLAFAAPASGEGKKSSKGQLYGPLHFNEDGTFHISVIQDTHMGDGKHSLQTWAEET